MWLYFVGRYDFFIRGVVHLTGKVLRFLGLSLSGLSTRAKRKM